MGVFKKTATVVYLRGRMAPRPPTHAVRTHARRSCHVQLLLLLLLLQLLHKRLPVY
jgi:hypothetical protein